MMGFIQKLFGRNKMPLAGPKIPMQPNLPLKKVVPPAVLKSLSVPFSNAKRLHNRIRKEITCKSRKNNRGVK